ncbi:4,5-DOPA dioxygenase extradiol [Kitasatospora sp. NPDC006697]|uniref:4,5-DOPA-extradiol-dioxygenase n=1 Tax=Kitasatospora sp. NPDC006697 TaxID=3364020 RepID=UPI0036816D3E
MSTAPALMPAAFLGHGSPMNAIEENRYTAAWRAFGEAVPRPRAVLVVSAHWYTNATAVTVMPQPRTIHDFYGFPQELFDVQYPAPGLPGLVDEVSEAVRPTWVGADGDSWGIDHGTWSVLRHAFPRADVPVVQLSINADQPLSYHFDLGRRLAPLRETGVLVVGSGNVVHNLRGLDPRQPERGFAWAERFDDSARELMTETPEAALDLLGHRDYGYAVPTPDHFIPLLYLAGLAAEAGRGTDVLVDGYSFGSLSMTAYTLDVNCPDGGGSGPAAGMPEGVPAEGTNA